MHSNIVALLTSTLLASEAMGAATGLRVRDPSDKSGNTQVAFQCSGLTLPQPGGSGGDGEGGFGYFMSNLALFPDGGDQVAPDSCSDTSPTCSDCVFSGLGDSGTTVNACWNPPAGRSGCAITFSYNGMDYDSQAGQSQCGHENSFDAFSDTLTAICYFNE